MSQGKERASRATTYLEGRRACLAARACGACGGAQIGLPWWRERCYARSSFPLGIFCMQMRFARCATVPQRLLT